MSDFHLDFICAGFNKCGTSSLHSVLKRIPAVQLPLNKKETGFFGWYQNYPDPVEKFQERYFPFRRQKAVALGSVEPSFMKNAENVYKYFGKDLKLIFMIRNPMAASWSMFKMRLRRLRGSRYVALYRPEYKNDIHLMFRKYIDEFIVTKEEPDYFYDMWISEFLKYYPQEQIRYIVFENFIRNYESEMQALGEFLQIPITKLRKLPVSNEGNLISRNLYTARINHKLYKYSITLRGKGTNYEKIWNQQIMPFIEKFTMKECSDKLSAENRQILGEVYRESVCRTSEMTGLPLEEYWYGK